jgi:uncharacterized protein (TIGR00730 family)
MSLDETPPVPPAPAPLERNLPAETPAANDPPSRRRVVDLIEDIKQSADRLASDQTSRGDLKILSRAIRELRYAFKVFAPHRWRRKVTVFGSARTRPHEPAYEQAVAYGKAMAALEWFVVTGASSGIMEAGHVGAGRDNSMGLNILLPFEQDANPVIAGDTKLVNMKYFFTRKLMFVKECDAVVCFPGGFGTLDEAFEVLTLLQTGKRDMVPLVLADAPGGQYWKPLDDFIRNTLLPHGMISPEDTSLYRVTNDLNEAVQEVTSFYRVYHSMRYVKRNLVLRLQERLSDSLVEAINDNFRDVLQDGRFVQRAALSDEKDEPELADFSRLVFQFNRRSLGRLRQLINAINTGEVKPPLSASPSASSQR